MSKACWNNIYLTEEQIKEFKSNGSIQVTSDFCDFGLLANQGVIINKSILGIYDYENNCIRKLNVKPLSGMVPESDNKGLQLLYDHLLNENISVICVNAPAGTGKTSTAMAYAIEKVLVEEKYKRIVITRPNVEVGKGHGFLPGDLDDKLEPLNAAFLQWLNRLTQVDIENLKMRDMLVMQSIAYIRGIDIEDSVFIVDEAQNLTKHEIKTILTRVGKKSKVIIIGDSSDSQIDKKELKSDNNGLVHVIDKWFGKYSWFGYVELTKCLRGEICEAAIKDL